jgi:hypothetical protein
MFLLFAGCMTTAEIFKSNGCEQIKEGFFSCPAEVVGMDHYKLRNQPPLCESEEK